MRIEALGEEAFILRELDAPAFRVAAWLNASGLPGLVEAVASYETVGLYVSPGFDPAAISLPARLPETPPRSHAVPVCYELGEDLAPVCASLGLSEEAFISAHAASYTCFAVGFCPGFAYLGYLAEPISGLDRRPSPRPRVEPGSVAITGRQTAVYPLPRPGGWHLIGKTPLALVDVSDGYFPIEAGDTVTFRRIDSSEFERLKGERL